MLFDLTLSLKGLHLAQRRFVLADICPCRRASSHWTYRDNRAEYLLLLNTRVLAYILEDRWLNKEAVWRFHQQVVLATKP